jgi:hypothetical protein
VPIIAAVTFLTVILAALTAAVVMIVVIIGIRREERELTLFRKLPPGPEAWTARRVLGLHIRKTDPEPAPDPVQPGRCPGRRDG